MDTACRKDFIICPLCRFRTPYNIDGAQCLMDNYFVQDLASHKKIDRCFKCHNVTHVQSCNHCSKYICNACNVSHEVSTNQDVSTSDKNEDVEEDMVLSLGMQGF